MDVGGCLHDGGIEFFPNVVLVSQSRPKIDILLNDSCPGAVGREKHVISGGAGLVGLNKFAAPLGELLETLRAARVKSEMDDSGDRGHHTTLEIELPQPRNALPGVTASAENSAEPRRHVRMELVHETVDCLYLAVVPQTRHAQRQTIYHRRDPAAL